MARQQSSIYLAEYPGGWETEIRIGDQTLANATNGSKGHRDNISIQVKKAYDKVYQHSNIRFIDWNKLQLTKLRSAS